MNHLRRLGSSMSISIPADDDGFTGRECPQADCEGYFKIELGTGLKGVGIPCHCPYCDHTAGHDQFWTKAQIEYAKSVAIRKITDAFHKDLKKLEFNHKPKGAFGIGISMKVSPSRLTPIHKFREKKLETEIVCDSCTLRYAVYGVFAFCPDCGQHNSSQIFDKNLELVEKMLDLAAKADDKDVSERLIENALEDCISAFDGFGREICRVHAEKAINPIRAEKISFQDLRGAQKKLSALFDIDLSDGITAQEWEEVTRGFQKRNLLSHKMGVVDEAYIRKTDDIDAVVGRKITLASSDVREVARIVGKLAKHAVAEFQAHS